MMNEKLNFYNVQRQLMVNSSHFRLGEVICYLIFWDFLVMLDLGFCWGFLGCGFLLFGLKSCLS